MTPAQARALETLFDHQMWAFGRDVVRPAGNLFALRGLERVAAPEGAKHSSTWLERAADGALSLCSLGVTYEADGQALRLERGPLLPQLQRAPLELLPRLAAWIAGYERWVERTAPGWRAESLAARRRPSRFCATGLEAAWAEWASSGASQH